MKRPRGNENFWKCPGCRRKYTGVKASRSRIVKHIRKCRSMRFKRGAELLDE